VHELSISSAIVDTSLRHAGGRQVSAVSVKAGALRQVVPESLRFYFEIVARDTSCARARLELEVVPAWLHCGACEREWDPAPEPRGGHLALGPVLPSFRCPDCGLAGADVIRGDELEVESIEVVESEEEPCIARG
jgi:hydrogenase nickel incorporation protein HypA/HybF